MRTLPWRIALIAAVALLTLTLATIATLAVRGSGQKPGFTGTIPGLAQNPLTDQQKQQALEIRQETQREVLRVRLDSSLTDQQKADKIADLRTKGHDKVLGVLTPAQKQELQTWRQTHPRTAGGRMMGPGKRAWEGGFRAGGFPGLVKNPLTDDQKGQIAQLREETQKKVQGIRLDTKLTDLDKAARIREARAAGHEKVVALLTAPQKEELKTWMQNRPCPMHGGRGMRMSRGGWR